jgi:hypothetical protein
VFARPGRRARPAHLALAIAILAFTSCRRDEVKHFRVAKSAPEVGPAMPVAAGPTAPPGMGGDVAPPASPSGADALTWKLPKGWTQSRSPGGMRYATLVPPATPGTLDVSVVVLPGPAGGELANVNRWRGQIGLPPLDEAALGAQRKQVKTRAGDVSLYDFSSEGTKRTRVVAGFTVSKGNTWFVKMSGDADAVATRRGEFVNLLESLRLDSAE